jgi:hypothetical protein
VEHVRQSFGVHQPVFEGHVEEKLRYGLPGEAFIQTLSYSLSVSAHFLDGRPIRWLVTRQPAIYRIDSKGKELVKFGVEGLGAESRSQQVAIKSFEMPDVENNPVALRNRPVIERFRPENLEQAIGSGAGRANLIEKSMMFHFSDCYSSGHGVHLPIWKLAFKRPPRQNPFPCPTV